MHDGVYSQNFEEKYIVGHFKNKIGSFLDIGAWDGVGFSNTYRLALNGWSGVCIEPSPSVFPALKNNHKNNKIVCEEVAIVVDKNKKMIFYDSNGDAISSFNIEHKKKWERNCGCKFKEIEVKTMTVEEMFEKFGYNFDFINLDVEAMNWNLFQKFPIDKLSNTKMFCIEHDNKISEIFSITNKYGFKEIHRNGENIIIAR